MVTAAGARAQAPSAPQAGLISSVTPDLPAWWGDAGRPGMMDESWLGTAFPWTLAGFTLGAWSLTEPDVHGMGWAYPGVRGVSCALSGLDSARVDLGSGAAESGFEAGLAEARAVPFAHDPAHTRALVLIGGGSFAYDDNALVIERGDSARGLRAEILDITQHEPSGAIARAGHHLWQLSGRWTRRRTRLVAGIANRGVSLALTGGEEEATGGTGGFVELRQDADHGHVSVRWDRAFDRKESFGGILLPSERHGFGTSGRIETGFEAGDWDLGLSASYHEERVTRDGDGAFEASAHWFWGAATASRPLGPGTAELAVGAGRHDAFTNIEPAPSLAYRITGPHGLVRFSVERVIAAAWSDLGEGEAPFLQSTWASVLEAEHRSGSKRLRGWMMGGRSRDRALVIRHPLDDVWLRVGTFADPDYYDFGLFGLDGSWDGRSTGIGGEGFALARSTSELQPRVDPGYGGRLHAEWRSRYFQGDLGVTLRAGVTFVGSRESEAIETRVLPAYATSDFSATVTLAAAVIGIRLRNIEDARRPETWVDSATGSEALSPGRELRFHVNVKLSN